MLKSITLLSNNAVIQSVIFALLAMSIASVWIAFSKLYLFFKIQKSDGFEKSFQDQQKKTRNKMLAMPKSLDTSFFKEIIENDLVIFLEKMKLQLEKGLGIVSTITSCAPFVGLFGTVYGIYIALTSIEVGSVKINLADVAKPMGEALVTTAIGIFVAIVSLVIYHFLSKLSHTILQHQKHKAISAQEQLLIELIKK